MNLHGKIMNIEPNDAQIKKSISEAFDARGDFMKHMTTIYLFGFRDARHAAAELAVGVE